MYFYELHEGDDDVFSDLMLVHDELIERNGLAAHRYASVYVQVTRGVAPRRHAFPVGVEPTLYVCCANAVPAAVLSAMGVSCRIERATAWAVSPRNGRTPVAIS